MSSNFAGWDDHTLDLAIQAFTEGLGAEGLEELHEGAAAEDLQSLESSIAAIGWTQAMPLQQPPASVLRTLEQQAMAWIAAENNSTQQGGPGHPPSKVLLARPQTKAMRRTPWLALTGWSTAAALVVVLFSRKNVDLAEQEPSQRFQSLVAEAQDLTRIDWSPTEDPLAQGAMGEVVWSAARQEGYMVFRGLRPNDPSKNQYQLWIFDASRPDSAQQPVDGGVFDVRAGDEVVVPIDAKLPVGNVSLFAITLEPPGGVVVSKREHLLLTAASSS